MRTAIVPWQQRGGAAGAVAAAPLAGAGEEPGTPTPPAHPTRSTAGELSRLQHNLSATSLQRCTGPSSIAWHST